MYSEQKLNSIVDEFRLGDEGALNKLVRLFLPIINEQSSTIWHMVEKETEFECRCLIKIKKALLNYDPNKGKLKSLIVSVIMREKHDFLSRRKRKHVAMSLDTSGYTDKDGKEVVIDVQDALAGVEERVIEKEYVSEKAALLAKGDSRKLAILNAWLDGETNDSNLAKELAILFPTITVESHRKAIQRFRTECQKRLANAV